jgi:fermentation-respiration switch protein FrsA (DUF1100 family)
MRESNVAFAMLRRVILFVTLVALLLGAAGYLGLRAYARSVLFAGSGVPFPAAEALGEAVRLLDYVAADGTRLRGAWTTPGREDGPVVLFFHGNAESAAQNLGFAASLARLGVSSFLAEYRGYGGLAGTPTETNLYADALAAREVLRARGVGNDRLVIVGRSLGTGVAVELAARERCRLLVLVSPYTSITAMGRFVVGPLAPMLVPDPFDSLSKASRLAQPVVVLHGTSDDVIPFAMGETLARAIPGARFVPLEGRGHNDIPELAALVAGEIARAETIGRGSS